MGAVVQEVPKKLSVEEYAKLPERPGFKDELIEGERVLSPMAKFAHAYVIDCLEALLKEQFPQMRTCRETGWHFQSEEGSDNVPGPDLMMVKPEDYENAVRSGGYFEGKPLIVVEVVSPSERKPRRMQKVGLYLEAGAESVVEVDYSKRCAFIYRADESAYEVVRDRMTSPFAADLSDIFSKL